MPWIESLAGTTVSVTDGSGSRHSVEVLAESVYEAAALGLKLLRDADWVETLRPAAWLHVAGREGPRLDVSGLVQPSQ
jgi:hypothetical protein